MRGMTQLREAMIRYLAEQEIPVRSAWEQEPEGELPGVVVSLQSCRAEHGAFLDYLGERYNRDTGLWEELYGRRAEVTFGLELRASKAQGSGPLQELLDRLGSVLAAGAPEGLSLRFFSCGETEYDGESRTYSRQAQAVCLACLYAAARPGETFLDFELRGGLKE